MDPYVFEQSNGLWYERRGDYYFPCLTVEEVTPIDVWGQRHLRFLKQNRRALYLELKTSGRLNAYLADIDRQAETMLDQLMARMAECEGVTEALKAQDQMAWVQRMNSIHHRASEIVLQELIDT
nr:TnpV protein [uncultured Ruminococcus sp.]